VPLTPQWAGMSEARWFQRTGVAPLVTAPAPRRPRSTAEVDPRVLMVLEVLGGRSVGFVAEAWNVEPSVVQRWVGDFLAAGSSVVTNRPDQDVALQRDRFLAAFAHEMRTPVTVAQGWAMALAEGDVPADHVQASFEKLSEALHRLSEHIVDVELSTAASLGRLRVDAGPVTLDDVRQRVPGVPAVRRGGRLTLHADAELLARILRDLWAIATREPEPASVAVDVVTKGPWHEIRVVRTGHPLGHRILQVLMDPFGSDNDDTTGVTTGLYTARALAVAHGGIIGAEGDEDSTVLLVRLPRPPRPDLATGSRASTTEGEEA
jgi:signal transduction histidine kinase